MKPKFKLFIQLGLALLAVSVGAVSTMAWFQISVPDDRTGSISNDTASLSVDEVTGYKYERDRLTSSTSDYSNGSSAAVNYVGDAADNNIQEGETTELDIPTHGMGYYVLSSGYSFKLSEGVLMNNVSGDSYAKIDGFKVDSGDQVKFINHTTIKDNGTRTVDQLFTINGLFSNDGTTQGLINNSTISLSNNVITINSTGSYYFVLKQSHYVEIAKKNNEGRTPASRKNRQDLAKKNAFNQSAGDGYDRLFLWLGNWWDNGKAWHSENARLFVRFKVGSNWSDYREINYLSGSNSDAVWYTKNWNLSVLSSTPSKLTFQRRATDGTTAWNTTNDLDFNSSSNFYHITGWSGLAANGYSGRAVFKGPDDNNDNYSYSQKDQLYLYSSMSTYNGDEITSGTAKTISFTASSTIKVYKRHLKSLFSVVGFSQDGSDVWFTAASHISGGGSVFSADGSGDVQSSVAISSVSFTFTYTNDSTYTYAFSFSTYTVTYHYYFKGFDDANATEDTSKRETATAYSNTTFTAKSIPDEDGYNSSGWFQSSSLSGQTWSSGTLTANKDLYALYEEPAISITLRDCYVPNSSNTNATGTWTLTINDAYGAATVVSKNDLIAKWTTAHSSGNTTYTGGYNYTIAGIYTSATGGSEHISGPLTNGATYYVRYIPVQYTLTRKFVLYDGDTRGAETSLSNLSTNSITALNLTNPINQSLMSTAQIDSTFGYEFSGWYRNGSVISAGTKPSGNWAIEARFTKMDWQTVYFRVDGPAFGSVVNNGWHLGMDLWVYAFHAAGNSSAKNGAFPGVKATHLYEFYYSMSLPSACTVDLNNGHDGGTNQTEDISLSDGLAANPRKDMILVWGSTTGNNNNLNHSWDVFAQTNTIQNGGLYTTDNKTETYYLNMYDSSGATFESKYQFVTGPVVDGDYTNNAHLLQIPISSGSQFVLTKSNNSSLVVTSVFGWNEKGDDNYSFLERGDQIGGSSTFAQSISTNTNGDVRSVPSSISNNYMFRITKGGIYDIYINDSNKVYFTICELKLNVSTTPNQGDPTQYDMHLGDGEINFAILESGVNLTGDDYVYISIKSNYVTQNFGYGDLFDGDKSSGYCQDSNTAITDDTAHWIKILHGARYAAYVGYDESTLKVSFVDMPEKGSGFYICQSDSGYYSFGKSIKMRTIANPSSYGYQYCAYSSSVSNETIKLKGYKDYAVPEVSSVSGGGATINSTTHIITLTGAPGLFDIYVSTDGTSAVITKRASNASFFTLNTYNGTGAKTNTQEYTAMVFRVKVKWTCSKQKNLRMRLTGSNVTKLGVATSGAVNSEYDGAATYSSVMSTYFSSLAQYTTSGLSIISSTSTGTNQTATFYVIVDYWPGQALSSTASMFSMVFYME